MTSVPMTHVTSVKICSDHIERLRPVGEFLGR